MIGACLYGSSVCLVPRIFLALELPWRKNLWKKSSQAALFAFLSKMNEIILTFPAFKRIE
jgi:hypothetical protein